MSDKQKMLNDAIGQGDIARAEQMIATGARVNNPDGEGIHPLFQAIMASNPQMVELLLKKGADPNVKIMDGQTPLHIVITLWTNRHTAHDKVEIARLLIDKGADLSARGHLGNTPLDEAYMVFEQVKNQRETLRISATGPERGRGTARQQQEVMNAIPQIIEMLEKKGGRVTEMGMASKLTGSMNKDQLDDLMRKLDDRPPGREGGCAVLIAVGIMSALATAAALWMCC